MNLASVAAAALAVGLAGCSTECVDIGAPGTVEPTPITS
jgi:hypothetical protein